jgi:hypothetical protein
MPEVQMPERTQTRVVVVKEKVPRFTPHGQRNNEMVLNGIVFADMWQIVKELKPSQVEATMMCFYQENIVNYWRVGITDALVKEMCTKVFQDATQMRVLRFVNDACGDLLYATDQDVKKAYINFIETHTNISSKKYIKKLLRAGHSAFFDIGRECKYEKGTILTLPDVLGSKPLMRNGNPVTDAIRQSVLDEFKKLEHERKGRYMAEVSKPFKKNKNKAEGGKTEGLSAADDEDIHELVRVRKHGLAVSVAVVVYVIVELFQELLTDINRINDTRRMVNMANLIMLYMFGIHEGCRPGEITNETTHNNLTFSLGEEFKLLCLVFVPAETFAYLLTSGYLTKYVCEFYKGKDKQHYRGRFLSWMPPPYNIMDLATMYVVLMRIIVALDPDAVNRFVFKQNLNFSALRQRVNKKIGISGMCYYSIRYAAAEDDIKYNIPATWTRYRMGHTAYSNMRNMYANNLNQRVLVDNIMTLLGNDLVDTPTNNNIPLRFMDVKGSIMHEAVPIDIPDKIIEELKLSKRGVTSLMVGGEKVSNIPEFASVIPKTREHLLEELKKIPIGAFISFKEEMLSPTMSSEFDMNIEIIQRFFAHVPKPNKIPTIWSYPQVMYGVWTDRDGTEAQKEWNALKAKEVLTEIRNLIDEVEGAPLPRAQNTTPCEPLPNEVGDTTDDDDTSDGDSDVEDVEDVENVEDDLTEWKASNIEAGDVIGILCVGSSKDKWSIPIPNSEKHIWLCHVSKATPKQKPKKIKRMSNIDTHATTPYMVTGNFYKGALDNLAYDGGKKQTVEVVDATITIIIYKKCIKDVKTLQLMQDEIDEICEYVNRWI